MAKLPVKQASALADSMAKQGLSGSIMMGKKMPMKADAEMDDPEPMEDDKSELDHCLSDVADAVVSGDKEAIVSCLKDLVDCIKQDDKGQDEEMEE